MDAARFARIQDLFLDALDRPPEEREAFLDTACRTADGAPDPDLRRAVEAYLEADTADGDFLLDQPLVVAPPLEPEEDAVEGRRVGPYRLLRLLGRGGMGAVYLAEREDMGRAVALKVVRGDLADPEARQRFRRERRLLARLEHPGITRLYDVGVADDGTPYFAMERVEGEPLTDYCDRLRLGLDARLRLFEQVGRTVQHAHQHFVVHRDLKPSNVYVTPEGEVKLLDFGIAKALDEAEQADDAAHTRTGRRLLTPGYAAPEQFTGEGVTAATDVYSLGVLLYELLTGHRPHENTAAPTEAPPPPSTAVTGAADADTAAAEARQTTPERLARRLRGDLDVICLKALQPEPARRYASAEAFVEDVKRHLAGLPVAARPDAAGYRLRKFVARHRRGVVASVLGAALLAAVVGFYTVRLAAERDRAQTEARTAERVSSFLVDLFGAADPFEEVQGDTLRAVDLLARGAARVETELEGEPEVQATLFDAIADVYVRLGRLEDAEPLYERALALRRDTLDPDDPALAETLTGLGGLYVERGAFGAADSLGALALSISGPDARTLETARALHLLGRSRYAQADYPAADSLHRRAQALFRTLAGPDNDGTVASLSELAQVAEARGDDSTATRYAMAVLTSRRRTYGDDHPAVAEALSDIGYLLRKQGRYAEAEARYREALAIKRRALGDDHPSVATTLNNLGVLLGVAGHYDEVGPVLEEALAIRRVRFGDVHPLVASTLGSLSRLAITQGDLDRALAHQDEALAILRQLHGGGDHPTVSTVLNNQARVRLQQGQPREAERLWREVLAMEQRLRGGDHDEMAKALSNVGAVLVEQGRYDEAESFLTSSVAMYRRLLGNEVAEPTHPMRHLARIATARGRYEEAERLLTEALRLQETNLGPDHPEIAPTREALAALYDAWGRPGEAARYRRTP
ncbi:MAG: serine/threonine-protein kinase [Rubricoccaceae bacterium]|nr:serine/threonine-protein kinase [Rubricoccaceae bacterium]